ncbi:ABC transporter ATP-binding protein [Salinimicrobium oceani]|uniref:ABC transporter ATP-binding protein n=1 Tax=Salinimicrobium oceani TaxID=2722702 RepID=A0ABX1D4W6_9FLAO|nr:ABC transporter ATP-binding protein [Salinimicrobium oceani]NJW54046.1 ABC transporter ATP-binding protein [Salinimicrobium oceani]
MSSILKAENISKQYRLGLVGTGTISDDLKRWWHLARGKEDPFLQVGAENNRNTKATEDYVWALRNIDFEVKTGEVLGIIGRNGAGKSTLLKILSRVTAPTTGSIKTRGRIASLLEVGTGFHGELTGRENIFMNGAVLGMTKAEIKQKLDEIIHFSGCEMYIDTPVKRYSSGMTVRLGFAVAAHLEPEILVVDEVLAVGDAEFQKKAIGKMQDLSTGEGRTVLFVSHNMVSVQNLCTKLLLLENGRIVFSGPTYEGIDFYLNAEKKLQVEDIAKRVDREGKGGMVVNKIEVDRETILKTGGELKIRIYFKKENKSVHLKKMGISILNIKSERILNLNTDLKGGIPLLQEKEFITCIIPQVPLVEGSYWINVAIFSEDDMEDFIEKAKEIYINPTDFFGTGKMVDPNLGSVVINHYWN